MKLEAYMKEECLRQAVEITRAYASSGENKHGPVAEFLEQMYGTLMGLMEGIREGDEECLRQAVEITRAYASSGENKHGPVAEFLEQMYRRLSNLRERPPEPETMERA